MIMKFFIKNFKSLRSSEINFNNCIETPILLAMLPDLHGKNILDIGCGMGQHAKQYSDMFGGTIHRPDFVFFRCKKG